MIFDSMWKVKPQYGKKFIYRYYDSEGKSYIGQTKDSLYIRAGGISGKKYLASDSKFRDAILEKGFDKFEYEILEEVDMELADERERYYIRKFDTRKNGYNSTHGGLCFYENMIGFQRMNGPKYMINLNSYSEEQLKNLSHNLTMYFNYQNSEEKSYKEIIDKSISHKWISCDCWEYHKGPSVECDSIVMLFNYIDIITTRKFNNREEMYLEMMMNECFGDDLLTGGFSALEVIKLDKTRETFQI